MSAFGHWMKELWTGVLGNLISPIVLAALVFLAGWVLVLLRQGLEIALLALLIVLVLVDIAIGTLQLVRQSRLQGSLRQAYAASGLPSSVTEQETPLSRKARREFEIADKHFDDAKTPQRLVIRYANRGSTTVRVTRVKYSDSGLGLPSAALSPSYTRDSHGRYMIPFDQQRAGVVPGQDFLVELELAQTWRRQDINRMAGQWGYLRIEALYGDEAVEMFYSI
jgi:hypothetical protein